MVDLHIAVLFDLILAQFKNTFAVFKLNLKLNTFEIVYHFMFMSCEVY